MTRNNLTRLEFAGELRQREPSDVRVPVRWLDQQLPDPQDQRDYARDRCIVVVTEAIGEAIERSGLTRTQIASKLGVTKGYVSQVLSGPQNITLKTLGDLMWACDVELHDLETSALGVVMTTPESAVEWARDSVLKEKKGTESRPKVLPSGVSILGIALRELSYFEEDDGGSDERFDEPWPAAGGIALSGRLIAQSAHNVEFMLDVRTRPSGGDGSFALFVRMSALFAREDIIRPEPFIGFLNRQGAPILMPYVREVVSNISSRGIYDTVNMAPIVLEPLLDDETVGAVVGALEKLIGEKAAASAPAAALAEI